MRSNKANVNNSIRVINLYNQAVFVAADIEHYATSFQDTGVSILSFDVDWGSPVRLTHLSVPIFQCSFGVSKMPLSFPEPPQGALSNNPHASTVASHSHFGNKDIEPLEQERISVAPNFTFFLTCPMLHRLWHNAVGRRGSERLPSRIHENHEGGRMKIVDGDSHFIEPLDLFLRYIEPAYRERAMRVVNDPVTNKQRMVVDGKPMHLGSDTEEMLSMIVGYGQKE